MRMWMVPPSIMCSKHLLGEHVELHMLVGAINKNKSLKGFIENGLIEIHNIEARHEKLVEEMTNRGFKHKSVLPKFTITQLGYVDVEENKKELAKRCEKCKDKQLKELNHVV